MKRNVKCSDSEAIICASGMRLGPRKGRPSASMAGAVEERILDAAASVFLECGFSGASLDRIAKGAFASKATLYSRYARKEALFSEVVRRSVERSMRIIQDTPLSESLSERLAFATRALVIRLLSDEVVGLIRIVVADAPRFPLLAQLTHERGWLRSIEAIATIIEDYSEQPREARSKATIKRNARILATQILDAIVAPLLLRAMLGQDLGMLRSESRSRIDQMLGIFLAAKSLAPFL